MQLRARSKDADDGASTSTRAPSVTSQKEEYIFPKRLIKDRDWRKMAILNKCDKEVSTSMNLALVFDFFNKFSDAFNLTKVTEEELDEAVSASADSLGSRVLVRVIVELLCGFTSIDCTHQMRMYHRNRVYRETTEENYNISLWEFFDHDWKIFMHKKTDLRNFFCSSKETADLFKFEPRIRAAILYDLCQYRLACLDAQDVIDSVIDESESPMGDQLRTTPIGGFTDEKYYYLGGTWVYRWKCLSTRITKWDMEVSSASHRRTNAEKRALREAGERRSQEQRSSGGKRRKLTGSENGVVKKEDSAGIGAKESMNNADVVNGDCKESSSEISDGESVALEASEKGDGLIRESRPVLIDKMNGFVHLQKETGETGGEENLKVVPVSDNNSTDGAVGELDPEDYFESLRNKDFLWEVVCRNEDHIHFLIEYFRETHKVGHGALAKALIDVVLPSVQKILQARKIAEKKKNRLVAVEVNGLYAGSHELRHSRRLEQKRIEREKRMEEQRKLEMELENQLREEEWKRAITGGTSLPGVSKQLSREERARLREQRIEQYSLARRLKMEGKDKASEKKDAASESSHNDELSGIRLPAQKLAVGEYGEASSSNTVLLESVEGSGPPKGKFCGNLPGRGTSCGVPEAQTTVMACSAASRRPNGQSFVTANWPVAETSSENVNSVAGSWQQFSCFSGQYQNVDWNKRQYRSTGEGASSTCSNRSGILSRKGVSAPRVVHNEFLVRKSFQNVYDSCTGSLARGERINLQGYSEYGVSRSAKNSTGPCCSGETVGLSSARTRPVNWMCHGMRRAGQSRPEACNTASMSLPWRSTVSVPSKQTEAANETAVLQETRPASADFYRTARAPSYVNESASSSTDSALWSVDNDGEASQEESAAAAKGFVDYPAFKDGQLRWFRIVEPVGTRIILQRDEPLKEHDYFLPTVEQIVANEWKFLVEPIDETSPIEKTEFLLQFGQQFEDPQQTANIDDTNCAEK